MKRMTRCGVIALLIAVTAAPAYAGPGIHLGASIDPDLFLVGLRFRSKPIETNFHIVPNIEGGFGDNLLMIAGNVDGQYSFNTDSKYAPYIGAGLSLAWYDFDGGDSNTEFGGAILGGIQLNAKWFFETKLGLGDVPDWKFIVGFEKP